MGSALYDVATRLEDDEALDGAVAALDRLLPAALREGDGRALLGGQWLGHALHPMLTDFPLGSWMSASLLDFVGGSASRTASRRLIAFGLLPPSPPPWRAPPTGPRRRPGSAGWASSTPPSTRRR